MYNVISYFSGARRASKGRVKQPLLLDNLFRWDSELLVKTDLTFSKEWDSL